MYGLKYKLDYKKFEENKINVIREIIILFLIYILIFILSTLQVKDVVSIWNQNDEFGVWQGGAWLLGLNWSEVTSTNGYYGYGYGFILMFFIKFFGHDTVLMTHMAIYFQALIHTSCIFIAWWCIRKMFPSVNTVVRIIASSVCIISIPDLFYNYMFFSESLLRFIVWLVFGLVVSYSYNKKWYKLFLVHLLSIYAFSIHQRCILLMFMAVMLTLYEVGNYIHKNGFKWQPMLKIGLLILAVFLFYKIEYASAQHSYIEALYMAKENSNVGGNLLSERGYTVKFILKDVVFNIETQKIAIQNMLGFIYYICAIDCGFVFWGFILCLTKIKAFFISKNSDHMMPYIYMSCMTLIGILLVVYQNANEGVYQRVELIHYGRYCSYLFAPMIMLGIVHVLESKTLTLRKNLLLIIITFLISGFSTYEVLKQHNVTNLFAFANACPGIKSVYYTENPFTATLYHTVLGVVWILIPVIVILISKKSTKFGKYGQIALFIVIAVTWINVGNKEWKEIHEEQDEYVTQTYDLQNILKYEDEFAAFKSFGRYGSGLLQYNNPFSKVYVCQTFDEFGAEEDGLMVVSQKGIDEMDEIIQKYDVEYENNRYFVWRYEIAK